MANEKIDFKTELDKYLKEHGFEIVPKGDVGSNMVYEDKPQKRLNRNYAKDPEYRYIEVETNQMMEENGLSIVHTLVAKGWEVVGQLDKYHIVVRMNLVEADKIRDAETMRARNWEKRPENVSVSPEYQDVASPLVVTDSAEKPMTTEQILNLTST